MDKGVYTALSGGIAKSHELELIANNLANANTPGFKKDNGTFNEYLTGLRRNDSVESLPREIMAATDLNARPSGDKSFVEMDGVYTDYRQGNIEKTGRTLDVALEGKGFFEVLTPSGVQYTRQGNFNISPQGILVTNNGYPVLSRPAKVQGTAPAEGDLFGVINSSGKQVPGGVRTPGPQQRVINLANGPIEIGQEGIIRQNGIQVAQLNIEEFKEDQWLEKSGNTYFKNTSPNNLNNEDVKSRVHQGFLESSNVNPISEMTRMIEATRAYESHLQAIKTYQEIDAKTANDLTK
jgi:flagellar basal-body rod protein FlgF